MANITIKHLDAASCLVSSTNRINANTVNCDYQRLRYVSRARKNVYNAVNTIGTIAIT